MARPKSLTSSSDEGKGGCSAPLFKLSFLSSEEVSDTVDVDGTAVPLVGGVPELERVWEVGVVVGRAVSRELVDRACLMGSIVGGSFSALTTASRCSTRLQ